MLAALATIVAGLAVHRSGDLLPPAVRDVLGDALWATMIVWWVSALAPQRQLWWRGVLAIVICFAVELSQMYQAPWLNALRDNPLGHLVLGNDFDPRDLAAYTGGILIALLLDRALRESYPHVLT